jgi:hypothetical protein
MHAHAVSHVCDQKQPELVVVTDSVGRSRHQKLENLLKLQCWSRADQDHVTSAKDAHVTVGTDVPS